MLDTNLQKKNHPLFKDQFDIKPNGMYLHFDKKFYNPSIEKGNYIEGHLTIQRVKFKMSVTHLAMLLDCSRPQYLRMERGENRFKDEQLETLAALYGEDTSTYQDMQDVDILLKKIGYNTNPERAIHLLKLALRSIRTPSSDYQKNEEKSNKIPEKIFEFNPLSKELRQRKLAELIEKLKLRFALNDSKMTEIGNTLSKIRATSEEEIVRPRHQFSLLEDEQISLQNLITKLSRMVVLID